MRIVHAIASLFLLLMVSAAAQTATSATPSPCTQAESKQLDFWVGEWNLTWPGQTGQPEGKGTNVIRKELGDCVIEENFDGQSSNGLLGKSFSVFNSRTGKWHQTWVDNQGAYLDLVGGWDGKEFRLSREGKNRKGAKMLQRMIFKNITPNTFDWSWEISNDDGKTWQVQWPIHYARKKG